jgi:hypothetical protein
VCVSTHHKSNLKTGQVFYFQQFRENKTLTFDLFKINDLTETVLYAPHRIKESSMIEVGSYVRNVLSPKTIMGTITEVKEHLDSDRKEYLFRQDPRFAEQIGDVYFNIYDIEECEPPTDEYVNAVNKVLKSNPVR